MMNYGGLNLFKKLAGESRDLSQAVAKAGPIKKSTTTIFTQNEIF
jgi:hypothetical protein